jgi:hypothetical protein
MQPNLMDGECQLQSNASVSQYHAMRANDPYLVAYTINCSSSGLVPIFYPIKIDMTGNDISSSTRNNFNIRSCRYTLLAKTPG